MDYMNLGLKVGLEIHQELATEHKLFCQCPPKLFRDDPEYTFLRQLRPSQSELGEIDPAALFEFMKGKTFIYEANRETSCLVEMDEEPPGPLNNEAVDISLVFALLTDSMPVDEIHVMRKIVVDGSNTTGFQRTCVVSLGGRIETGGKLYRLQQISLEEDAARKISEEEGVSRYRIDRLGIPLIEIVTAPDIYDPKEAEEVALAIGRILRATGKVRRGLGTIRQDLNISIVEGALIEVKGVQELSLISKVVEFEVQRQVRLLELTKLLQERNIEASMLNNELVDVSELFKATKSPIIKRALNKGGRVMAVKLPGFAEVIGAELCPNRRLGTEMSDCAKYAGDVKGLFHSDELQTYNITNKDIEALKKQTEAGKLDAVVIIADFKEKCERGLRAVIDRAKQALVGVPAETRSANPDGTTYFTRPRPGAARMYPETDVVTIQITSERLTQLKDNVPEMPEEKLERFKTIYSLNDKLAKQIINSEFNLLFEKLADKHIADPTLIAVTLTETLKSLDRDGINTSILNDHVISEVFQLINEGSTVKESIPQLLTWLSNNPNNAPKRALEVLGLTMFSAEELKRIVNAKVDENRELIERLGSKALGPLMGMIMGEVRGRADPSEVQTLIRDAI
jgi:glutamyl-tRNA(Gln) amidotransferase subunit E